MEAVGKLTNVQLELLKLFQYNLPEKQLAEIKNILAKYFAKTATEEMDKLWIENNWTNDTMKEWANEHLRKK
jgi:glycine betaine/choline ABC-type transport system substrate-binding protein